MKTLAQVKKAVSENFKSESIKFTDLDGKLKCYRNYNNKIIKGIPTGVTHSPMDATNVKRDKVRAIINEIYNLLLSLGGELEQDVFTFTTKTKKFSVIVSERQYVEDKCYSSYMTSYIRVLFID